MPTSDRTTSRRRFLGFLATSPLIGAGGLAALAQTPSGPNRLPDPMLWAPRDLEKLILTPKDAINVFDFEAVASKNVPPAHFGYMVAGVDDEVTLRANREGFLKFQLRPRRLIDVSKIDMRCTILGAAYDSPIFICPTASNRAFHPDGEVAVAKAARSGNHLQTQEVTSQSSYYSHNDLRLHFGIGTNRKVDALEIRWPNGQTERIADLSANQIVTIKESMGLIK